MEMHAPVHPGEVLREYLPENLTITDASKHLGVTRAALSRILNCKAGISAEMDLLLSDALGTSAGFWSRLQVQYDIWQAKQRYHHIARFPQVA
ncbi:MAG: HigA family addiction module antitoxin [Methylotenera sp.]|jgi:addiction module HigA family antidote|nr:MAG: addiction module antidote protein, HigA family [Methylotenera sp.]PPD50321.1 MAG: addiction module antidote protein, HigA family [Methylotenera sp.]HOY86607.1 HigA family addiction module antitoxin [Methylotenera sp.]HPH07346.1 HigA family addiction module antitoxin [Methylotenera sp.]HPM48949.1 HigA family addiction module antitoxin [Methylotenera sp.]